MTVDGDMILADIAVALLKSDYPAVTDLLYRNSEREQMMLPWHAVKGIDWHHARIHVSNFDSAQPVTKESLRRSGPAKARRDRRTCARFA